MFFYRKEAVILFRMFRFFKNDVRPESQDQAIKGRKNYDRLHLKCF